MGARVGKQDEEYLRGAWEWAGELGSSSPLAVRIVMHPSQRKGVWLLRAEAVSVCEGRVVGVHTQVRAEWPTDRYSTLAGAILALTVQLDHALTLTPLEAAAQA